MNLDCDHICDRICHNKSSHAKLSCTQPCRRLTCPEKHPCPNKCFEECGKCVVDVIKKLPCGHDVRIWVKVMFLYNNVTCLFVFVICRGKSNAGSSLKMRIVKSKLSEFFPIANIRPFSTVVNPPKVTNALDSVGNFCVTMDTYAESFPVNPAARATFKWSAH